MIMYTEMKRTWEEQIVAYLMVLSWQSAKRTVENQETLSQEQRPLLCTMLWAFK
jgi:hypothetical protein